jgi:hypothetical protein
MKTPLVLVVLASVFSASAVPAAAQADTNADLRQQVKSLEQRLAELEKGLAKPSGAAKAPVTVPQTKSAPFAFADFTWLNGNSRVTDPLIDNDWFTGQFMVDVNYTYDFNHPKDHTLDGVCEVGRTNEFQLQQLGVGGDLHYGSVRGRLMTQFGMYSQMTPRNDATTSRGQWNTGQAYQYISEGYGGYHWDVMHGINLDAGIFMSYVGLFSYYQNENWAYSPSYVSANTPWYFNGLRLQLFPTEKLKIEPWITNGFQTYNRANEDPGYGVQILYRPTGWLSVLGNQYYGHDTLNNPRRARFHTDDSVEVKYYDHPQAEISKAAFSITADAGCEEGGGVSCTGSGNRPKQDFLGFMVYDRTWFHKNKFGLTLGGGSIINPGRYLVLLPPINSATAATGSPYFTQNPGDSFKAWDMSATFDYMPSQYVTWRAEYNHRQANVPYFAGAGGMTPAGGNTGTPGALVPGFAPDLRRSENRVTLALLVRL